LTAVTELPQTMRLYYTVPSLGLVIVAGVYISILSALFSFERCEQSSSSSSPSTATRSM
jgi:hypothetical protein